MEPQQMRDRDLVLPPNTYAHVLDSTKGKVSVFVGPYKSSLSNTDRLVGWNEETSRFEVEDDFEQAIKTFIKAIEGQYIVLNDPAEGRTHPAVGTTSDTTDLAAGRRIVIPGPISFPLWPGQTARAIDGHHLKSNQYLLVRVYEPEQARENAQSAVVAPTGGSPAEGKGKGAAGRTEAQKAISTRGLTMGQLMVIKGTEVSFYIPSTGIEVIPELSEGVTPGPYNNWGQTFVREAATLERLEYVILLDEDGEKRYVLGPDVVFPEPTEAFITDDEGNRKFRAIELNEQSGLYVKVIADYTEDGKTFTAGEELFLTGKDQPIYFARAEHSIIHYGDQKKHHAIAIPKGEGRYVLDRNTGEVQLVNGPKMFLPDPRHQVVVRRILDPKAIEVMYPGNAEAARMNAEFEQERLAQEEASAPDMPMAINYLAQNVSSASSLRGASLAPQGTSSHFGGEKTARSTTYRKPRTITLSAKYEGAVAVNIWPGYAVLVTDKTGHRRVEAGPKSVLLEYDESLMALSLSTGRPKSDDRLLKTVYLRTVNNQVSDQVTVETSDLVPVSLELSLRVNFEGKADTKWFDIENYVGLLTDHCRSRLRNVAKRHGIREFYANYIDIIRDALLGPTQEGKREGLLFAENSMRLYDIEVLDATINNPDVGLMLAQATEATMAGTLRLAQVEETAVRDARMERIKRDALNEQEKTSKAQNEIALAEVARDLKVVLAEAEVEMQARQNEVKLSVVKRGEEEAQYVQNLTLQARLDDVEMSRLESETAQFVTRMGALAGGVIEALQMFGDKVFVQHLVESLGPVAVGMNISTGDILGQVFKGTQFEGVLDTLTERPYGRPNGDGQLAKANN